MTENFRAGFAAVLGRPNAGKSTLTNALCGTKIAITSSRPETTRRVIRGIVTTGSGQIILTDTPGLHRPRTLLGERLGDMVRDSIEDTDCGIICLPADEKTGPGDRYLLDLAKKSRSPLIAVVTKTDKVSRAGLAERLAEIGQLADFAHIVPVCAPAGDNVDALRDVIVSSLPLCSPLYPLDAVTDESEETLIAELIREAALEMLRDELPHSLAVTIDETEEVPREGKKDLLRVHASIHVERSSQKGIIIGHKGSRLREIGTQARKSIQKLLDTPVYLDLHVRVAKDWQRDPKQLVRLGF
ncbi:MAG: GTPase Era [Actinomycetaceae bacterium]|nr:GTPase Era [Actinomycetaceae bacterium]